MTQVKAQLLPTGATTFSTTFSQAVNIFTAGHPVRQLPSDFLSFGAENDWRNVTEQLVQREWLFFGGGLCHLQVTP
jgi:hypothetical protein